MSFSLACLDLTQIFCDMDDVYREFEPHGERSPPAHFFARAILNATNVWAAAVCNITSVVGRESDRCAGQRRKPVHGQV